MTQNSLFVGVPLLRVRQDACARARPRERQKNEDMTRGRDGTKVYVVVMKGNQVHRDKQ